MIEYGLYWMGKAAGRGGTKEGAYIVERKFACLLARLLARLLAWRGTVASSSRCENDAFIG